MYIVSNSGPGISGKFMGGRKQQKSDELAENTPKGWLGGNDIRNSDMQWCGVFYEC